MKRRIYPILVVMLCGSLITAQAQKADTVDIRNMSLAELMNINIKTVDIRDMDLAELMEIEIETSPEEDETPSDIPSEASVIKKREIINSNATAYVEPRTKRSRKRHNNNTY